MPLENATSIAGFDSRNPLGSDSPQDGDDHIRMIKAVLQAQFRDGAAALGRPINFGTDFPSTSLVSVTGLAKTLSITETAGLVICTESATPDTPVVATLPGTSSALDGLYYTILNARTSGGAVHLALGSGEQFAALGYSLSGGNYVLATAGSQITVIRLNGRWYLYNQITPAATPESGLGPLQTLTSLSAGWAPGTHPHATFTLTTNLALTLASSPGLVVGRAYYLYIVGPTSGSKSFTLSDAFDTVKNDSVFGIYANKRYLLGCLCRDATAGQERLTCAFMEDLR